MTKPINHGPYSIERKLVVDRIKHLVGHFRAQGATEVTIGPISVKFELASKEEKMEARVQERISVAQMEWEELPEEERMALETKRREELFYHSS